jgi:hypothetical protein
MDFTKDPNDRRRLDREAMNQLDERAWELQKRGWSVREIARELGKPVLSGFYACGQVNAWLLRVFS